MAEPLTAQERLVREVGQTVHNHRVLDALLEVPRDRFVPPELRAYAFENEPLPIGSGQTISQPLIVGMMTEALDVHDDDRVLEIGTGSGYQAAVLARLAHEVVTTEVHDDLRQRAETTLHDLGITNVTCLAASRDKVELGASHLGPYDAIIVTAAAPAVPESLLAQLKPRGRLVIPVGSRHEQDLLVVTLSEDGSTTSTRSLGGCQFVPLLGPQGFKDG